MRIRARLGLTADITDDFIFGLRLATGNTTNPVSTNQTLGSTLANDNFVLDRAYLEYNPWPWLTVDWPADSRIRGSTPIWSGIPISTSMASRCSTSRIRRRK